MKLRYFIPFFVVSAGIMMLLHTVWLGTVTGWTFHLMRPELGKTNLVILHASGLIASATIGLLTMPLGYLAKRNAHYGFLLALLGLAFVFKPWNPDGMTLFKQGLPLHFLYLASCWLFWSVGSKLGKRKSAPKPGQRADARA